MGNAKENYMGRGCSFSSPFEVFLLKLLIIITNSSSKAYDRRQGSDISLVTCRGAGPVLEAVGRPA
jgi:hypothetical protein